MITKVTCFRRYGYYCPRCKRVVKGKAKGEMPKGYLGLNALSTASYFKYRSGLSYKKIEKIFKDIFRTEIDKSSLTGVDNRFSNLGEPIYQEIEEKVRHSSHMHSDETGWPVDGENRWLWG